MVTSRGRKQHWDPLLKASSTIGLRLSTPYTSFFIGITALDRTNKIQSITENGKRVERRGMEGGARVWMRTRCDQDNSVSVIVAQTVPTRAERAAIPPASMSANNEEAPGEGGGGKGEGSRSPVLIASSRYNSDEEKSGLVDSFGRRHVAESYRRFGHSMSISPRLSAKFPANSISASRAKYSPGWLASVSARFFFFFLTFSIDKIIFLRGTNSSLSRRNWWQKLPLLSSSHYFNTLFYSWILQIYRMIGFFQIFLQKEICNLDKLVLFKILSISGALFAQD